MKLSNQATGALLMTLQKCLAEQADITELLSEWILEERDGEVFVLNPPFIKNDLDDSLNISKSEILIP
jgi:hypothetical protein